MIQTVKNMLHLLIQKLKLQPLSVFLSLFTIVSFALINHQHYWVYFLVLFLQLIIIFIGFFFHSIRFFAFLLLACILIFQINWQQFNSQLDTQLCENQPEQIYGNLNYKSNHLVLIRDVQIYCKTDSFYIPFAQIQIQNNKQLNAFRYKQFGHRIEIKNAWIKKINQFHYEIKLDKSSRVYNENFLQRLLNQSAIKSKLLNKAKYYLSGDALYFFQSIILFERYGFDRELKKKIVGLGVWHLFAISGLHVGLIFIFCIFILRIFFFLPFRYNLAGFGVILSYCFSVFLIYLYLNIIGSPVTAMRAWLMITLWLVTRCFLSWVPQILILLMIASILIAIDPFIIQNASFQISYYVTFVILSINHYLKLPSQKDSLFARIGLFLKNQFILSALLFFCLLFIQMTLFKQVILASILNNILHINFVSIIYLPVALIVLFFGLLGLYFPIQSIEIFWFKIIQSIGETWYWLININYKYTSKINIEFMTYNKQIIFLSFITILLFFIFVFLRFDRKKYYNNSTQS